MVNVQNQVVCGGNQQVSNLEEHILRGIVHGIYHAQLVSVAGIHHCESPEVLPVIAAIFLVLGRQPVGEKNLQPRHLLHFLHGVHAKELQDGAVVGAKAVLL